MKTGNQIPVLPALIRKKKYKINGDFSFFLTFLSPYLLNIFAAPFRSQKCYHTMPKPVERFIKAKRGLI